MKRVLSFLKTKDLYYAIVRYGLSMPMMSFGIMKVLGLQFHTMAAPSSSYQQPLEYLTGIQLTWAFLGYSTWFQVLLGIFEFVPASFLLFRRTAFLGAMFLLPMTLSVLLINYGLHLWIDTQWQSLVFLLLNLSIFLFEWKKVKQIMGIVLGVEKKYKYILPEIAIAFVLILIPVIRKARADYGRSYQNVLTGDVFNRHPIEYLLISEKINDSTITPHLLKSFFGSWEEYSEINDRANNWDGYRKYSVNERDHILNIFGAHKTDRVKPEGYYYLSGSFDYELPNDTLLILHEKINDSTDHTLTFRKRIMNPNRDY